VVQDFRPNWYPFWSPRFWHGLRATDWIRLLWKNRFAVHPARVPLALTVSSLSVINSLFAAAQSLALRRRIEQTRIEHPPLFVIGHWRTGTTLLHELLTLDSRFAFPRNYDCFVPHHFLLSKRFFGPVIGWLLPNRRPMDDMLVDPELPQEDEFAIGALGSPTPYTRIAFPNHGPKDLQMLNLDEASPECVARFRSAIEYFFKALTLHYGNKPLVLKSPPHTGRIRWLAEWFPGARFIHLSRHPYQVVPSTMRLWPALDHVQGLQIPRYPPDELLDYVNTAYRLMYGGYFRQRQQIPSEQLIEVRFEDLTASPESELERIYAHLRLGGLDEVFRRKVAEYREHRRDHRPSTTPLPDAIERRVRDQWREYFAAFDYESISADAPQVEPVV
jgi:hypothetical protein